MQQRLFEITNLLIHRGSATAAELAQRFGVSRRTIYRDIDALSLAGIPVYAERGREGGIRILPEYVLDKSLFSKEEQTDIMAYFEGLASLGTPGSEQLLSKLGALFGPGDSWLEVDFMPWGSDKQEKQDFSLLRECILTRKVVSFEYTGSDGTLTSRSVEPYQLVFRGQGWYLRAYCLLRQSNRLFRLTRLHNLQPTGEGFLPRPQPPHTTDVTYTPPGTIITLRFSHAVAFRVYDEFPLSNISTQPDGSLHVTMSLPLGSWVTGFLLSFGADAEVLHPPELRASIAQAAASLHALYT